MYFNYILFIHLLSFLEFDSGWKKQSECSQKNISLRGLERRECERENLNFEQNIPWKTTALAFIIPNDEMTTEQKERKTEWRNKREKVMFSVRCVCIVFVSLASAAASPLKPKAV